MNAFLVALVLAVAVSIGSCADTKMINCYTCQDYYNYDPPTSWKYNGCTYPFNKTEMRTVACPGQCVSAVEFDPTQNGLAGSFDKITRGCTVTPVPVGCWTGRNKPAPYATTCVSVCSTDLCNSADSLMRRTTFGLLVVIAGLASLLSSFGSTGRRN